MDVTASYFVLAGKMLCNTLLQSCDSVVIAVCGVFGVMCFCSLNVKLTVHWTVSYYVSRSALYLYSFVYSRILAIWLL